MQFFCCDYYWKMYFMRSSVNFSLCILFVCLWSSGWVGAKYGVGLVGPFTFLTWRYLIVVVLLGVALMLLRKWKTLTPAEWLGHLNVGFLSHGVYLGASLTSMEYGTSAGMVALVTSMQPMFTGLLAQRYTGETTSKNQWIGIGLGLTAVLTLVVNQINLGSGVFAYMLLVTAVIGLCIATLIERADTLSKENAREEPTPLLQVMFIHSIAALAFFTFFGVTLEQLETNWSPELVGSLAYMAVFVSIGSYGLMFLLLRRLPAVKVSSLAYLTQGTTMIMAWVLLGETLSGIQWLGLALASAAVLMVQLNSVNITTPKTPQIRATINSPTKTKPSV